MSPEGIPVKLDPIDRRMTSWMARHGVVLTRLALGIVFFWFGALKLVPGWSPAEQLASKTMARLTFSAIDPGTALIVLAIWEVLIGLGLLTGRFLRVTLFLLWVQMLGTLTPLFLFPGETFRIIPFAPTLEGQYIIKNLVLIAAAIMVGATVRGRRRERGGYLEAEEA